MCPSANWTCIWPILSILMRRHAMLMWPAAVEPYHHHRPCSVAAVAAAVVWWGAVENQLSTSTKVNWSYIVKYFFLQLNPFSQTGYTHNPYNGVVCNDIILATGVFSSKELWRLSKGSLLLPPPQTLLIFFYFFFQLNSICFIVKKAY